MNYIDTDFGKNKFKWIIVITLANNLRFASPRRVQTREREAVNENNALK